MALTSSASGLHAGEDKREAMTDTLVILREQCIYCIYYCGNLSRKKLRCQMRMKTKQMSPTTKCHRWLKNREIRKGFLPRNFPIWRSIHAYNIGSNTYVYKYCIQCEMLPLLCTYVCISLRIYLCCSLAESLSLRISWSLSLPVRLRTSDWRPSYLLVLSSSLDWRLAIVTL